MNPVLALIEREGMVLEENGANREVNILSNETGSNAHSANTSGIVFSNDPHLSSNQHLFNLLNEPILVSMEEMMEHDVGGEFLGRDGRRVKFLANTTLRPAGRCWTRTSWAESALSLETGARILASGSREGL